MGNEKAEKNLTKMSDRAGELLFSYPAVTTSEKGKRLVKKILFRQKIAPLDAFSWPNAMLGDGLLAAFSATGEQKAFLDTVVYLEQWAKKGCPIHYADNIMNGKLAMWVEGLMEHTPSGDSTAPTAPGNVPEGVKTKKKMHPGQGGLQKSCREILDRCADWLRQTPKTAEGILPYRPQHPDWIFADTIGMVCPFLCRYGAQKGDVALLRLGIRQMQVFLERGMDRASGLPYHGYEERTGMKYGVIGWGRACGWLLKGMADSLPWLTGQKKEFAGLLLSYRKLAAAILDFQRPDGGFSWLLPATEGHRDTSAEGMIGAALCSGLRMGYFQDTGTVGSAMALEMAQENPERIPGEEKRVQEALTRLSGAMEHSLEDGVIRDSLGECVGFGEYPQVYGVYPWGMGSALEFFSEKQLLEKTEQNRR